MITNPATLPGNDIRFILSKWRTRTLAIILIVASLLVFPAIVVTLFRLVELKEWFWAAFLLGMYFILVFLTFYRNVDFRLRGYTVLFLGYVAGIFALIVGGPTGDGRLFLMVMPLFAFMLIGLRSGWAATSASLFIYLVFVILGGAGELEGALREWLARVGNPFAPIFWMMTWATLAALLVSTVTLLDRFYRLLLDALIAERDALAELAHAYDTTLNLANEMRQKLARDLHDGPAQKIAGLAMQLYYIGQLLSRNPEEAKKELEKARATAQQTVEEIRTALFTLRPLVLETKGYTVEVCRADHRLEAWSYAIIERSKPGRFHPEKAARLGVPQGIIWKRLQDGEDVDIGERIIKSSDVVDPPRLGRKVVYTGDTRPSDDVAKLARGADLLIHESTFGEELVQRAAEDGHSTAGQAAEIASKAGVKMLILTHISGRYSDAAPLLEEARRVFPDSIVAADLLEVDVPPA